MDNVLSSIPQINFSYWILQTLAMMLTALIIPRLTISGPLGALITVISLALVNSFVWDAALFFSIPDNLSVHMLTLFLANGIIFWILVKILPGIEVQGFLPAFVAPVVFTICSIFISKYLQNVDWVELGKLVLEKVSAFKDQFTAANEIAPTPVKP